MPRDSVIKGAYLQDFFSGAQARIYIHDVWVSDLVDIQFQLTNNKTPIYGYNSELYDAVAKGRQIIQGQFSIAFKETGYLNLVMANYKKGQLEQATQKASYLMPKGSISEDYAMNNLRSNSPAVAIRQDVTRSDAFVEVENKIAENKKLLVETSSRPVTESFTAETRLQRVWEINSEIAKLEDQLQQLHKTGKTLKRITNPSPLLSKTQVLSGIRGSGDNIDDESLAERIEDNLLGLKNTRFNLDSQQVGFKDGIVYIKDQTGIVRPARPDELDFVEYQTTTSTISAGTTIGEGFKLYVIYGNVDDAASEHTIHVLNDVHINAIGQVVEPNGNPILEVYTYMAKSLDTVSERSYAAVLNEIDSSELELFTGYVIRVYEETPAGETKELDSATVAATAPNAKLSETFTTPKTETEAKNDGRAAEQTAVEYFLGLAETYKNEYKKKLKTKLILILKDGTYREITRTSGMADFEKGTYTYITVEE